LINEMEAKPFEDVLGGSYMMVEPLPGS